jgi:hypothetical protein
LQGVTVSTSIGRHRAPTRLRSTNRRRRVALATITVGAAISGLVAAPALAGTSVGPSDPGTNPPVVRRSSVTVSETNGAQFYYRIGVSAAAAGNTAFTDETQTGLLVLKAANRACLGNNPAGRNNSPRDTITVTAPGGAVVATQTSPARNISAAGAPPLAPQPAPGDTNYLGDFPASAAGTHGMSFTVDLTGRPAGIYTVTTVTQNMVKTDTFAAQGACTIGFPSPTNNKVAVAGPQTSTTTFEYRPWQNTFADVFGGGKVFANATPNEFQFTVGSKTSQLYGAGYQHFYTLPGTTAYSLPSDPAACAANPASCLPSTAIACDPSAGCTPRLMTINKVSGTERLQGVFDLQTKAFIAGAYLSGTERELVSLGTANDATYHDLLAKLAAGAAAQGINLASLLATQVRLRSGSTGTTLSLLNGLQIAPSNAPGGLQIVSDTTAQAGVILDVYANLTSTSCVANSGSSVTTPQGYTQHSGVGYTVSAANLPSIPAVGPLGAIASGPIYHIVGNFPGASLSNTASAVIGIDSAADEPNGYPVWIEPFVASGHVSSPKTLDFLGTATWSASESPLLGGCLVIDAMLGTGVALYNNPLPVGFGTLLAPVFTPNAATAQLTSEINAAVQGAVTQVTANPTVSNLLTQLVGGLPL